MLRRYPPLEHLGARPLRPGDRSPTGAAAPREALSAIDGLLAEQPDNAYFHELKGQALLESRPRPRGGRAAAPGGSGARPNGVPIRAMLGQALVATERPELSTRRSAN